ncbi:MAG TPA: hypothetical protein VGJ22_02200 [Anaerolineales bacterium]|jgi:hypothetical protein
MSEKHLKPVFAIHVLAVVAILTAMVPAIRLPWSDVSWIRSGCIACMFYLLYLGVSASVKLWTGRLPVWAQPIRPSGRERITLVSLSLAASLGSHYFLLPAYPAAEEIVNAHISIPQWIGPVVALVVILSILMMILIFVMKMSFGTHAIPYSELVYEIAPLVILFALTQYLLSWFWGYLAVQR